jgi:cytochrome c oxidase cbb3-type subunit I/II
MLIAPSWGGMINGLLTLRGAWDKVRKEPMLKFFVVALTAYGMATFEGPMLSLKKVNAIAHFTDWIVAHVHVGALGWNGFMIFAILYWLIPRIYKTELYSKKLASVHFWLGTLGILFYAIPLYWGAVVQGLMWKEFTPEGTLKYPNFLTTVLEILPMYMMRAVGGALYLSGAILMTFNLTKTMKQGKLMADEPAEAMPLEPVVKTEKSWHRRLERKPALFMTLTLIVILIGGMVEMMPTFMISSNVPTIASVKPYTPLELQGRDIYIREGCMGCHSQMVRPFRSETTRYGEYSKAGEYVYDHTYLWGSKRTGPDLHRLGGKYPNKWHYDHMLDPTITSPGSIMPAYPWLIDQDLDKTTTPAKIRAMQILGVPYPTGFDQEAITHLENQANEIVEDLKGNQIDVSPDKEIVAMIAYLQRLGTDIKVK